MESQGFWFKFLERELQIDDKVNKFMEKKLTHANFFYGTTYTLIFVFVLHIYTSKKNNEVFRAAHSKTNYSMNQG